MRRRPEPSIEFPMETDGALVPPVAVAVIDGMLNGLRGDGLMDKRAVRDLLLDVRNALWQPNGYSLAVANVLDTNPKRPRSQVTAPLS